MNTHTRYITVLTVLTALTAKKISFKVHTHRRRHLKHQNALNFKFFFNHENLIKSLPFLAFQLTVLTVNFFQKRLICSVNDLKINGF